MEALLGLNRSVFKPLNWLNVDPTVFLGKNPVSLSNKIDMLIAMHTSTNTPDTAHSVGMRSNKAVTLYDPY